jgi:hypothetical protein
MILFGENLQKIAFKKNYQQWPEWPDFFKCRPCFVDSQIKSDIKAAKGY